MQHSENQHQSLIDLIESVQTKLQNELKLRDEKQNKLMSELKGGKFIEEKTFQNSVEDIFN